MCGGAWPFLVGGLICLVDSDNERDQNKKNREKREGLERVKLKMILRKRNLFLDFFSMELFPHLLETIKFILFMKIEEILFSFSSFMD